MGETVGRFAVECTGEGALYTLSQEKPGDWWEVEALYDHCFAPGRTLLSSYRLRDDVPPVPELCRVAHDETGIIGGAIRYWPVRIGRWQALLLGPVAVHPTAQGEGLRALVYFGPERLPSLPDVPTARELGYDVAWANPNWWLAPADTPDAAVAELASALEKAIADPEIQTWFAENTLQPYWTPGDAAMRASRPSSPTTT